MQAEVGWQSLCLHCGGRLIKPKLGRPSRFCSAPCRGRYRYQHVLKGRVRPKRPQQLTLFCLVCGSLLHRPKRGRVGRFCSSACRNIHHVPVRDVRCKGCGEMIKMRCGCWCRPCRARKRNALESKKCKGLVYQCRYCGSNYQPTVRFQRYCSQKCNDAHHKAKKRCHRKNQFVENVTVPMLLERNGDRCGICGEKVDAGLRFPHPDSPSVDHIIPVTKGGEHSMANCQLAHLGCNARKGDRVI